MSAQRVDPARIVVWFLFLAIPSDALQNFPPSESNSTNRVLLAQLKDYMSTESTFDKYFSNCTSCELSNLVMSCKDDELALGKLSMFFGFSKCAYALEKGYCNTDPEVSSLCCKTCSGAPMPTCEQQVTMLYKLLLCREPDASGLFFWGSQCKHHKDRGLLVVEKAFRSSKECQSSVRCKLNQICPSSRDKKACKSQVEGLYKDVLCRSPDQTGFKFWMQQCASGMTKDAMETHFRNSGECQSRDFCKSKNRVCPPSTAQCRANITSLYNNILCRTPDFGGLSHWGDQCATGTKNITHIQNALKATTEYAKCAKCKNGCKIPSSAPTKPTSQPTGCWEAQPMVVNVGHSDFYRGWYDVQGCGKCNDYCRWVGNSGSGGDPKVRTNFTVLGKTKSWWSCQRAGSVQVHSDEKVPFNYVKCAGKGAHNTCKPAQDKIVDEGHADAFRGWYDVQGCGVCYDYCRWVGNSGSGGDPRKAVEKTLPGKTKSWWSCQLAGPQIVQSVESFPFKLRKCAGKGAFPPVCMAAHDKIVDAGYEDSYRGWYDVQGCGKCNDYCRWVGKFGSGGDPKAGLKCVKCLPT